MGRRIHIITMSIITPEPGGETPPPCPAWKQKLKSRRGMSLSETMIVVFILFIVMAALDTGLMFAWEHLERSMALSEANMLYSTLYSTISNELSNTQSIVPASGDLGAGVYPLSSFFSHNYASSSGWKHFEVLSTGSRTYGELALVNTEGEEEINKLLGAGAYPHGLGAKVQVDFYQGASSLVPQFFRVTLSIANRKDETLLENSFDVIPLNPVSLYAQEEEKSA